MKLEFKKQEDSRANKVYLVVNYAGGDADTEHPEETLLKGVQYENLHNNMEEITAKVEQYKLLKSLLDCNDSDYVGDESDPYSFIEEKYGEEIARMYDNIPNDPQADYQFKCYIDDVELIGYDSTGTKYKAYVL